jgi:hypothetical protein
MPSFNRPPTPAEKEDFAKLVTNRIWQAGGGQDRVRDTRKQEGRVRGLGPGI